jgi:hypothetical protein
MIQYNYSLANKINTYYDLRNYTEKVGSYDLRLYLNDKLGFNSGTPAFKRLMSLMRTELSQLLVVFVSISFEIERGSNITN